MAEQFRVDEKAILCVEGWARVELRGQADVQGDGCGMPRAGFLKGDNADHMTVECQLKGYLREPATLRRLLIHMHGRPGVIGFIDKFEPFDGGFPAAIYGLGIFPHQLIVGAYKQFMSDLAKTLKGQSPPVKRVEPRLELAQTAPSTAAPRTMAGEVIRRITRIENETGEKPEILTLPPDEYALLRNEADYVSKKLGIEPPDVIVLKEVQVIEERRKEA